MELTPTTELEAVNEMLTAIGEVPVNTLDVTGITDAAIAADVLRATLREVLGRGWYFNTDLAYTFAVAVDLFSVPPANLLKAFSSDGRRIVMRQGKFYDRDTQSFEFDVNFPPIMDATWMFDFTDIPETFRRFVTVRAARLFQSKVMGSETTHSFTSEHEREARAAALDEESQAESFNYLSGSTSVNEIWSR